ncbi:hypothetical protein GGS23DRAFT_83406 [Durotheca rogersii]|uniref:uncharacterized protein n=1 Tax=Durotheca rogersii TaxID=419775 RepID=UPI0022201888|nr:uncharacterized protein GGS23DRAFT_83406 [Durotheca rogersii]KAI5862588.1 hypothetical protein GGS23DRAFT_83406 [Durotheca rogersii]
MGRFELTQVGAIRRQPLLYIYHLVTWVAGWALSGLAIRARRPGEAADGRATCWLGQRPNRNPTGLTRRWAKAARPVYLGRWEERRRGMSRFGARRWDQDLALAPSLPPPPTPPACEPAGVAQAQDVRWCGSAAAKRGVVRCVTRTLAQAAQDRTDGCFQRRRRMETRQVRGLCVWLTGVLLDDEDNDRGSMAIRTGWDYL